LEIITEKATVDRGTVLYLILAITASYFVPELLSITTTAFSESVDAVLTKRASLWETLSLVRLGVLVVLAITLMAGLTKPNKAVVK
jgi:hypothetical protein